MKTNVRLFIAICLVSITAITSCAKEGCTDPDAKNYDHTARKNNSTCKYEAKLIVWTKPPCADLNLYLDNTFRTSLIYTRTTAPDCSGNLSAIIVKDLGSSKSATVRLKAEGSTQSCAPGFIWQYDIVLKANTCTSREIQ